MHFVDPISQPEPAPAPLDAAPLAAPARTDDVVDLLDVLALGLTIVCAFFFLGAIATGIFMLAHPSMSSKAIEEALRRNVFFTVPTQFVVYLVIVSFMALLVRNRHRTSLFLAIHWNTPNRRRAVSALMLGAALAVVSDIGEVVFHRWIPDSLPITEYFKDRPSALLLGAFGILVAPLMEEMVFRGFLYPALARWTGALPSILLTAFLFGLLHGAQLGYSWAPILLIFVVGVTLTVTRAVTKSVATCVIVHMTYNFVLFAQTYVLTHGFRQMQGV